MGETRSQYNDERRRLGPTRLASVTLYNMDLYKLEEDQYVKLKGHEEEESISINLAVQTASFNENNETHIQSSTSSVKRCRAISTHRETNPAER